MTMVTVLGAKVLCAAALFVTSTGSYGNQIPRESDCLTVNQTKTFCLDDSRSSSVDRSLPLTCPVGFNVLIFTASVYLSPAAAAAAAAAAADGDCSSEIQAESVLCFQLNKRTYQCSGNKCNIVVPVSTSDDLCDEGQRTRRRYAVIVYRCQPEFSQFANATATALALDSDVIASNPLIAINNDILALTGVYTPTQTPLFCSGVLPRNSEVSLRVLLMMVRKPVDDEGDWTSVNVHVLYSSSGGGGGGGGRGGVDRHSFWSADDPAHVIGCSDVDRVVRVFVASNNSNASTLFALNLQVSYLSEITMQCNSPASPSTSTTISTEKPTNKESTTSTKTQESTGFPLLIVVVVCGVGGLITTVVVIVVIVVIVWHRSKIRPVDHRPLSETSSVDSSMSMGKEELSLQTETHSKPQFIKD